MEESRWRLDQYKETCLGTNYDDINPKCVKCDDRKECVALKTRWENKIKELFTKKIGVKKIKTAVPVFKNRPVKKTKEQMEKERRAALIKECEALGLL